MDALGRARVLRGGAAGQWKWLVRKGGIEPPWSNDHRLLRPARLPIPPLSRSSGDRDSRLRVVECQSANRYSFHSVAQSGYPHVQNTYREPSMQPTEAAPAVLERAKPTPV